MGIMVRGVAYQRWNSDIEFVENSINNMMALRQVGLELGPEIWS